MRMLAYITCLLMFSNIVWGYHTGTVSRPGLNSVPIVYYISEPAVTSFPILIMLEGSSSKGHLSSIVHAHENIGNPFTQMGFALLTVEQWGIDANHINENVFWKHYTRSQRLSDHQRVIDSLKKNPPKGWNGKFIFLGGSEGGALATTLMINNADRTLATVNWIGAVDWTWEEQFWQFYVFQRANGYTTETDIPNTKKEYAQLVREIKRHPTTDKWLGGMTYLYHADAYRQGLYDYHRMKTPLLVVVGDQDSIVSSTDIFVEKAKKAGAPVTYLRVKGMGHEVNEEAVEYSLEWLGKIVGSAED